MQLEDENEDCIFKFKRFEIKKVIKIERFQIKPTQLIKLIYYYVFKLKQFENEKRFVNTLFSFKLTGNKFCKQISSRNIPNLKKNEIFTFQGLQCKRSSNIDN